MKGHKVIVEVTLGLCGGTQSHYGGTQVMMRVQVPYEAPKISLFTLSHMKAHSNHEGTHKSLRKSNCEGQVESLGRCIIITKA